MKWYEIRWDVMWWDEIKSIGMGWEGIGERGGEKKRWLYETWLDKMRLKNQQHLTVCFYTSVVVSKYK